MSSFTSASQHYQDYRDYPMVVHPNINSESISVVDILEHSIESYTDLIDTCGVLPEEARQVLPNASAVDIIWTVNARSLENFFYQRLCRRNVAEMRIVSEKIYREACKWWPELFEQVGPACFRSNCDQGKMSCGRKWLPGAKRQGTVTWRMTSTTPCHKEVDRSLYCTCTAPQPDMLDICAICTLIVEMD